MQELAPVAAAPVLDAESVAQEFPILSRRIGGHPLVYLDSANTAQKPRAVLDVIYSALAEHNANIHRAVYPLAHESTEAFEGARRRIADRLGSAYEEIVFTKNATEAINLVAYAWGRAFVNPGDTVLLTEMEHHSNIVPWQLLARERGAHLRYVPVMADGRLDMSALDRELATSPKLVGVVHVSNVLGTVNPVEEIVARAHRMGSRVLIDGAQAAPHLPLDLGALDADFYVFTGHKCYGPTGIGCLWGRAELLAEMPPWQGGGAMIEKVTFEETTFLDLPARFEAGTPHIVGAVGLHAAVDWVEKLSLDAIHAHECALVAECRDALRSVGGVTLYGPEDSAGIVSFNVDGVHPHDTATILDDAGVAVRAGHHCAQPLMRVLGVEATARASFAAHSDSSDIEALVRGIEQVKRIFSA